MELITDLVEARQVGDADLTHELDLELLAVTTEFGRLDVALLFELFLVADCVLEVVELISRRLDVLYVRDLTEKAFIIQLLKLLVISDVGLVLHDISNWLGTTLRGRAGDTDFVLTVNGLGGNFAGRASRLGRLLIQSERRWE